MNIRIPAATLTALPASITPIKSPANEKGEKINQNTPPSIPAEDTVALNNGANTQLTYTDPRLNKANQKTDIEALLEESNRKAQAIVDLILPLVEQQGLNLAKVVRPMQAEAGRQRSLIFATQYPRRGITAWVRKATIFFSSALI